MFVLWSLFDFRWQTEKNGDQRKEKQRKQARNDNICLSDDLRIDKWNSFCIIINWIFLSQTICSLEFRIKVDKWPIFFSWKWPEDLLWIIFKTKNGRETHAEIEIVLFLVCCVVESNGQSENQFLYLLVHFTYSCHSRLAEQKRRSFFFFFF